jgi:hypothetical protein
MSTTKPRTTKFAVVRLFCGERGSTASTHRTRAAAEKAADKLLRDMGEGWGVRVEAL